MSENRLTISKDKVKKIIREILLEGNLLEAMKIYEAECVLTTTGDRNITDIFTDIRAIEGVTIVSVIPGYGQVASPGVSAETARVKIKFVKGKFSLRHLASSLTSKIGRIRGVVGVKIVKTRIAAA